MAEPFRIGIIGAGAVSDGYHAPVLSQMPQVRLEWVYDLDARKASAFASRHHILRAVASLHEAPAVDAVLIAIPVGVRAEALSVALERGWHAMIEKPFATSRAAHETILARAAKVGVLVGVGFMRRFYRSTLAARELIRAGAFGPLREVLVAEGGPLRGSGRDDSWYQNDAGAAGGGVLIETGSHLIDQVMFVTGATSFGGIRAKFVRGGGLDLDARVQADLEIPGGARCRFVCAFSRIDQVCENAFFVCERGTIRLSPGAGGKLHLVDSDYRVLCELNRPGPGADAVYGAFHLEWADFIASCRGVGGCESSAATALLTTAFIEAAYGRSEAAVPS